LIWCALVGFFRPRASLEAEILVLRHQLNVLRRNSPKRSIFSKFDRLIFAGLYGLAPNVLSALAIVKPEPQSAGTVQVFAFTGDGSRDRLVAVRSSQRTSGNWSVTSALPIRSGAHQGSMANCLSLASTSARRRSRQVHGKEQEATVARVEDVSAQSC
jgi:hypothetical protein